MKKHTFLPIAFILVVSFLIIAMDSKAQMGYSKAPDIATILFDGTDFSHWTNCDDGDVRWRIVDGAMEVVPDTLYDCKRIQGTKTRENYKDFQLHIEFKLLEAEANSGIYIHRSYEIQISNTYKQPDNKYMGGSIYRQKLPDVNMGKPVGEWQSYDIIFRSPRFESNEFVSRKVEDARITVIHNGVVIHNNVIVHDKTGVGFPETPEPGPIMLQDHGSLVQFRNIWIIPSNLEGAE